MRFIVRVKPGSRRNIVRKDAQTNEFIVETTARPKDGEANKVTIALLAKHFKVPKSAITIFRGHRSRIKIIKIERGT